MNKSKTLDRCRCKKCGKFISENTYPCICGGRLIVSCYEHYQSMLDRKLGL